MCVDFSVSFELMVVMLVFQTEDIQDLFVGGMEGEGRILYFQECSHLHAC